MQKPKISNEDNVYDILGCMMELAKGNKACITGQAKGNSNYWSSFEYWIKHGEKILEKREHSS